MNISRIKKILTIVIISHKSASKVVSFIKKLSNNLNILVVDNSRDLNLKKKLRNQRNVKLLFMKNKGYGAAINHARKFIKTQYFFVFSPDLVGVNNSLIHEFYKKAVGNLNFGALGPRYLNVTNKSHKQSDVNKKIGKIKSIAGSAIFINNKAFDKVNGFDENIFLFFEETDFCKKLIDCGYEIYQLNNTYVEHPKGISAGVVNVTEKKLIKKLSELYSWHFLWSKFYFYKKKYGYVLSIIFFIPIILRTVYRIMIYTLIGKKIKRDKYISRLNGLYNSIIGKSSFKRL